MNFADKLNKLNQELSEFLFEPLGFGFDKEYNEMLFLVRPYELVFKHEYSAVIIDDLVNDIFSHELSNGFSHIFMDDFTLTYADYFILGENSIEIQRQLIEKNWYSILNNIKHSALKVIIIWLEFDFST